MLKYFNESEFKCKCCGTLPPDGMDEHLLYGLDDLREHLGRPIRIVSGYRCPEYNAKVGGAKASQHMLGRAADVRVMGLPDFGINEVTESISTDRHRWYMFARGGIGVYTEQKFIHLDVRGEHGMRFARWRGK